MGDDLSLPDFSRQRSAMIELSELVDENRIVLDLDVHSKRQALRSLAGLVSQSAKLDEDSVYRALMEREKLGTTGIGEGLAIPHAKLEALDAVLGCFARLKEPVEFDALDEEPVDLVFLILAPAESGADHLKALARVARIFRDKAVCGRLRDVATVADAMAALAEKPQSPAP